MGSAYVDHEHFHGKPFSNVIASSGLVALDFKIEMTAGAYKRLLCCPCSTFARSRSASHTAGICGPACSRFLHMSKLPIRRSRIESLVSEIAQNARIGVADIPHRPDKFLQREALKAIYALRYHWPEYLMETAELASYMFFACAFAALLQHPASPVRHFVMDGLLRRMLYGLAMGATAIAIVMSPWGKQSGGHCNPGITFTFYRLGKVDFWDAFFYATGQFIGAIGGVAVARFALRGAAANHAVRYAVTAPGNYGVSVAFLAEFAISFSLMLTVLIVTNHERLARYTPYFAGALVAMFLTFEWPLSGMSMNPARTLGSAFHASYWNALWIYFTAPPLGMLAAAELFLAARGGVPPICAKLHHANNKRCIFHCGYRTTRTNNF